ncbi:unnamed protein product [Caretta caretta]
MGKIYLICVTASGIYPLVFGSFLLTLIREKAVSLVKTSPSENEHFSEDSVEHGLFGTLKVTVTDYLLLFISVG